MFSQIVIPELYKKNGQNLSHSNYIQEYKQLQQYSSFPREYLHLSMSATQIYNSSEIIKSEGQDILDISVRVPNHQEQKVGDYINTREDDQNNSNRYFQVKQMINSVFTQRKHIQTSILSEKQRGNKLTSNTNYKAKRSNLSNRSYQKWFIPQTNPILRNKNEAQIKEYKKMLSISRRKQKYQIDKVIKQNKQNAQLQKKVKKFKIQKAKNLGRNKILNFLEEKKQYNRDYRNDEQILCASSQYKDIELRNKIMDAQQKYLSKFEKVLVQEWNILQSLHKKKTL